MIYLAIGALAGLLIASVVITVLASLALRRLVVLLTTERAAHDERLLALVARIDTAERMELRPVEPTHKPDPATSKYISDEPYMDEKWNEYRGETGGDDE